MRSGHEKGGREGGAVETKHGRRTPGLVVSPEVADEGEVADTIKLRQGILFWGRLIEKGCQLELAARDPILIPHHAAGAGQGGVGQSESV